MRRSDLRLRLLALGIAVALVILVHGEKRAALTFALPVAVSLPAGVAPAAPLPAALSVTVSGPWARLRNLAPAALGPIPLELSLSRGSAGAGSWYARPELLHVPRGLRVDAVHPSQGAVELLAAPGATSQP